MNNLNGYTTSFGAPYADATTSKGADIQPHKYNGKEIDLIHGLNTYGNHLNKFTERYFLIDGIIKINWQ